MIKTALAAAMLLAFAACRTANDRPVAGALDYKCADCDKTASANAGASAPLCCNKTMQVTSTEFAEEISYKCSMENCPKTKMAAAGAPAPS